MNSLIEKANILAEALPYINKLANKTVVIKYGGNVMDAGTAQTIFEDIALLKIVGVNPVMVHGGGPAINEMLAKLNIKPQFYNGLRITDKDTMEVVEMVLSGKINKTLTAKINALGVKAIGICGKDGNLIEAERAGKVNGVDLGYVGEIKKINKKLIDLLIKDEYIPVIASLGVSADGESLNINADTVAGEIAKALQAEKLIYLTANDGVLVPEGEKQVLLSVATPSRLEQLIAEGVITGGMIPKVQACINGVNNGIKNVHIINGGIPHPIMLEIFTDKGIGTMVEQDENN
ncbi:MAG: acetylglutamate kinase [Christensenellales bacterium]|jgi:acetylglutamate kinase